MGLDLGSGNSDRTTRRFTPGHLEWGVRVNLKIMTDQEIEQAAEKHTETLPKATRLTGFFAFKGGARWADEYHRTKRDEYAEEYAKAFLHFILTHPHKSKTYDQSIADFKESLKK